MVFMTQSLAAAAVAHISTLLLTPRASRSNSRAAMAVPKNLTHLLLRSRLLIFRLRTSHPPWERSQTALYVGPSIQTRTHLSGPIAAIVRAYPHLPNTTYLTEVMPQTSCMFSSIAADGCEIADFKCHCSSGAKIRPQLAPCITKACSPSDEDGKMSFPPPFPLSG
jgi:hypothetical protein